MIRLELALDDLGRLACSLDDGETVTSATSTEIADGLTALSDALADLDDNGLGEAFWLVSAGEFRWVFRRLDGRVRLAVLWCGSVAVGFQHVFWAEDDLSALEPLRAQLAAFPVPAA